MISLRDAKKYPDGVYFWVDKNNDQTIQADELSSTLPTPEFKSSWWKGSGIRT